MNPFYLKIFDIACKHASATEDDISNKEKIILTALDKISSNDRNFICMLKPVYSDYDPNGIISMSYVKTIVATTQMNPKNIRDRKEKIRKELINQIIALLSPI